MGEHARTVADRLRARLVEAHPSFEWTTEYRVDGTPVDVGGVAPVRGDADHPTAAGDNVPGEVRLVELEWRRADPADNAAKLFRALVAGDALDADRVALVQVFTGYYDLASGGVSSKRLNAEFVGERVARTVDRATYRGVTLPLDPPKRGGELPDGWEETVDGTAGGLFDGGDW